MPHRTQLLAFCRRHHNPNLVSINSSAVSAIAASIGQPELTDWDFYLPETLQAANTFGQDIDTSFAYAQAAYFFFVQTALQYCFWDIDSDGNQTHWCYKGDPKAKGSRGCVAMTLDWWQNGKFLYLALTPPKVSEIFAADVADMPLAESRLAILNEVADFEKFRDTVWRVFRTSGASTRVAAYIAQQYPTAYADPFLKKAQLFLGLLTTNMARRGTHYPPYLTAYSDYRIPQVLRHLGVLDYAPALAAKVDSGTLLESGSPEELAIRAATLLACAELAAASDLSDMEIDSWLFEKSREASFQINAKPFHLTRTTHY